MNRVVEKVTSGQWVLTVTCAFVFAYMSCSGKLDTDAIIALIGPVFVMYFQRNRNSGKQEQTNETSNS